MSTAAASTTVEHAKGLHARPASLFVQLASKFEAEIKVSKAGGETEANAKSSISVIGLGVESGDEIEVTAEGPDADEAIAALVELVEADFPPELVES